LCRCEWTPELVLALGEKLGVSVYETMWGPSEFIHTGNLEVNFEDVLSQTKIPTSIICGEHDEANPEYLKQFDNNNAFVTCHVVSDSSHLVHIEQWDVFHSLLSGFLIEADIEQSTSSQLHP